MANDHFVAQTYLKHFGDASRGGILHGYQKSTGRNFPCWPYDVCREWEGDLNPVLIKPALLGDFRMLFEPRWDAAIAALHSRKLGAEDRFAISGYFANLMVCTPAWRRVAATTYNDHAKSFLIFSKQMKEKYGGNPGLPVEAIEMLERGEIRLDHDPNYIKAVITRQLMDFAWLTYHSDWTVIRNATAFPFITSDNPVAVRQSVDLRVPMTRYLPITPDLCLSVAYDGARKLPPIDASVAPMGRVKWGQATPQGAKSINRLVAQCAEELVISTAHSAGIESLVRNCAHFRVDADFVRLPSGEPDAVYDGTIIRVHEVR
jgi:hypothetical protein